MKKLLLFCGLVKPYFLEEKLPFASDSRQRFRIAFLWHCIKGIRGASELHHGAKVSMGIRRIR